MTKPLMLTVDDFVEAASVARDADTWLSDVGSDLLAEGVASLSELARSLGITRQALTERVQVSHQWREVTRAWSRVTAWREEDTGAPVRVSTVGRFVVFDMGRAMQENARQSAPTCWRVLRHTTGIASAEQLAAYLGREASSDFRYVRKPADLDPGNVLPWRLP